MKRPWAAGLAVALGVGVVVGQAEDDAVVTPTLPVAAPTAPTVELLPPVALGRPRPLTAPAAAPAVPGLIVRAQAPDPPPPGGPLPAPPIGGTPPILPAPPAGVGVAPPVPPPGPPNCPPGPDRYNWGVVTDSPDAPARTGFWDKCRSWLDDCCGALGGDGHFRSDREFEGIISPISNPFLAEDPRSLTEVRPLFLYQKIPGDNYLLRGGDAQFYGLQARLALTPQLSIVMPKLGYVSFQPNQNGRGLESGSGFGEIWLGPKWTFVRNDKSGTLAAAGLNFVIPTGSESSGQGTGGLALEPYLTLAQQFGETRYGAFNVLGTAGLMLGTKNERSDYFFTSLHLDYDIGGLHRFYPVLELNWFHYTDDGKVRALGFEGRDYGNFGSTLVQGHDDIALAAGLRIKLNDVVQFGGAAEWPVTGRHDLLDFRLTFDLIFRF